MFAAGILKHLASKGILPNFEPKIEKKVTLVEQKKLPLYNKKEARQIGPLIGFNESTDK